MIKSVNLYTKVHINCQDDLVLSCFHSKLHATFIYICKIFLVGKITLQLTHHIYFVKLNDWNKCII